MKSSNRLEYRKLGERKCNLIHYPNATDLGIKLDKVYIMVSSSLGIVTEK